MEEKKLKKKATAKAMKTLYAPEHCTMKQKRKKGHCIDCAKMPGCDKDFEIKYGERRLMAIGTAIVELQDLTKKRMENLEKGHKPAPAPAPAAPVDPEKATEEQAEAIVGAVLNGEGPEALPGPINPAQTPAEPVSEPVIEPVAEPEPALKPSVRIFGPIPVIRRGE